MPRYEVRCHEWGDDSDYHWAFCDSYEDAQRIVEDFEKKDPDNIYERLYIVNKEESR
jgi:hypothetical protein